MLRLFLVFISCTVFPGCQEDDLREPPKVGPKEEPTDSLSYVPPLNETVIYEVNMRAFSTSGTFSGVEARLDNIREMGTNVIWLMPIYPIGQERGINSPYSISDFEAVHPEYGALADLESLIKGAHSRGMAVVLDWVANHTAWDHRWITDHPDWYTQDANGNIISPEGTGWADVADLNYENTAMRQEMIESMKFWLENTEIDGFRLDAVDWVPMDFWSEAVTALENTSEKELLLLAEGGEAENFSAGFEINYSWDFQTAIKRVFSEGNSAQSIINTHQSEYSVVPNGSEKLRYITNHDIYAWDETVVEIFGLEGSVAAFVITAYLDGVPLIYTGQEIGHPSNISFFGSDPLDWTINPDIYAAYKEIMAARADLPAVHSGEMESFSTADVVAFRRSTDEQEVLVLVNVRDDAATISLGEHLQGDWLNVLSESSVTLTASQGLDGYEYLIMSREL